MAMQLQGTGIVHKQAPVLRTHEGQTYNTYRVINPGSNSEPIIVNLMSAPGSVADKVLETLQKDTASKSAAGQKVYNRILFQGHSGTLNVTPTLQPDGKTNKEKTELMEGVVHKLDGIDVIATTARQTILDTKAEPDQISVTMFANCEQDDWSSQLRFADGLQVPLQPGQDQAYHIRLLPENPVVTEVLHGIGKAKDAAGNINPDFIPPMEGLYFLSGSLIRESAAGKPVSVRKGTNEKIPAFQAWDRTALQVTTAFLVEIQDMQSQKETNTSVVMHTPDTNYFAKATAAETDSAEVSFGSSVDDLLN